MKGEIKQLLSVEKCEQIIAHVIEVEAQYQQQLLNYKTKLEANKELQAKYPKRKLKKLKEPEEPLHGYTSLATARKHLQIHLVNKAGG